MKHKSFKSLASKERENSIKKYPGATSKSASKNYQSKMTGVNKF